MYATMSWAIGLSALASIVAGTEARSSAPTSASKLPLLSTASAASSCGGGSVHDAVSIVGGAAGFFAVVVGAHAARHAATHAAAIASVRITSVFPLGHEVARHRRD